MKRKGFNFPILVKLTLLIFTLLGGIGLTTAWQNAKLFSEISSQREEQSNLNLVNSQSYVVEVLIRLYSSKIKSFGLDLVKESIDSEEISEVIKTNFIHDPDLLYLVVKKRENGVSSVVQSLSNEQVLEKSKLPGSYFDDVFAEIEFPEDKVFIGEIPVFNVGRNIPMLQIGIPILKNEAGVYTHIAISYVRLGRLQKAFAKESGERTLYLIDSKGKVVAHPDEKFAVSAKNFSSLGVVKDALKSKLRSKQKYYEHEDGSNHLAVFAKTPFGLIVIAEAPEAKILAPAKIVKDQSYYLLGIVLSLAFFLVFAFSTTITNPIEKLLGFTKEISQGNFEIEVSKEIKSRDEVGSLAVAFDTMVSGLRERDKIKNMFNKFHGSSVTEELLKTSLDLKGTSKEVIVFFSDIRGFTDFSEHHTAEEVVSMLNSYFEVMVGIITKYGGVVDKFVGDAIMAVWGVPQAGENDTFKAVTACLEMRKGLEEFNTKRIEIGEQPIKMGIGLHSGRVVSGTIGSTERMEFTVIGDTVNTSARIEASTKAFGTDLLISQTIVDQIKDHFIINVAGECEVKGKAEALKLCKVAGYIDENGQPVIVKTPYSDYEAQKADKVKIAS